MVRWGRRVHWWTVQCALSHCGGGEKALTETAGELLRLHHYTFPSAARLPPQYQNRTRSSITDLGLPQKWIRKYGTAQSHKIWIKAGCVYH